jgi:hypothetical protein
MPTFFRTALSQSTPTATSDPLRGSKQFQFCSGKCQSEKPPEGGVEVSPGKWRCGACWIGMARKRQAH